MPQSENSITVKDRLYISDLLTATLTAAKKVQFYATLAQDKEIADRLNQFATALSYQYDDLVALLEE